MGNMNLSPKQEAAICKARDNATLRSMLSNNNSRTKKMAISLAPIKCLEKKNEEK